MMQNAFNFVLNILSRIKLWIFGEVIIMEDKELYWNTKKPQVTIVYKGRTMPSTKSPLDIDVRQFIMPSDPSIQKELSDNDLLVTETSSCDDIIVAIYKHIQQKFFNYEYDNVQFGVPELWMFPFELAATSKFNAQVKTKGDCDDWAITIASYLIGAGVPYWRVRCVAGTTWGGFGHLTVYVLDDTLTTWRHINSTTPFNMISQEFLEEFPTSNDQNDEMGIKDVWFSFSLNPHDIFQKTSWHEFETSAPLDEFKNEYKDLFIIKP